MSDEVLSPESFAPLVGCVFHLAGGIDLRLTEVLHAPPRQRPFSLLFLGPSDRPLAQGIRRMTPDAGGDPLDIFLVPIRRVPEGLVYEAVFG
jgi:hypothetical protein